MRRLVACMLIAALMCAPAIVMAETLQRNEMIQKARQAAKWLEENDTLGAEELSAFCEELGVAEVCAVDANAIIVISSVPEYIGFDMSTSDQSAWFLQLLENPKLELVQEPMPRGFDERAVRQFVGVAGGVEGGFTQVAFIPAE